jgi:hypothetical protein
MTDNPKKRGPKPKPEALKVKPLNLKLAPELLTRLDRIRNGRKWPATLESLADKWDGKGLIAPPQMPYPCPDIHPDDR